MFWSMILVLVAVMWTDFVVDEFVGMRHECFICISQSNANLLHQLLHNHSSTIQVVFFKNSVQSTAASLVFILWSDNFCCLGESGPSRYLDLEELLYFAQNISRHYR